MMHFSSEIWVTATLLYIYFGMTLFIDVRKGPFSQDIQALGNYEKTMNLIALLLAVFTCWWVIWAIKAVKKRARLSQPAISL